MELAPSLPTLAEGSETSIRTRGDTAVSEPSPTRASPAPEPAPAAGGGSSSEAPLSPLPSPHLDEQQAGPGSKRAFTGRSHRVVSVSGGGLHNDMLSQLTALRAVANASNSGTVPAAARRPLAQTYQRRPKMSDVRKSRAANLIAAEWRRKQLLRELLSGTDEKKMRDRLSKAEASAQGRGGVVNGPGLLDRSKASVSSLASSTNASSSVSASPRGPAYRQESPRGEVVGVGVYRKTEPRPAGEGPSSVRTKMWRQHSRKAAAAAPAPAAAPEYSIGGDDFPKPQRTVARDHGRGALATQLEHFGDPNPGELHPLYCDVNVFDRFGTDVSQYFHFMYHSKTFFIFLFVINLSNIIINIEGNTYGFDPFVMHTIGNTAGDGVLAKGGHSYAFMEFLTSGLLLAYLFWIRGEMETIYDRVRGNGQKRKLTAADFSVMVANIPPTWGSDKVRAFFEKSFGEVVHVGLSLDYRTLIQAVNQTRRLKDDHNDNLLYLVQVLKLPEAEDAERNAKKAQKVGRARAAVMKSMQALEGNDHEIKHLMKQRYRCTGYAFVTFDKLIVAQAVKQAFKRKNKTGLRVLAGGLTVEPAPEPHDVIWENLQCSPREVLIRQVVSCLVMFSLCMLGTSILFLTNAALTWEHAAFSWVKETSVAGFLQGVAIWLLSVLLIVAGHLVLIIAVIVLANTIERPHTHGDKEISVMLKISFFQWFNNFAQSIVFLFLETEKNPNPDGMFSAGWYGSGGALIINALIGDLVVINLLIDGLKPEVMIQRYVLTRWAKTQARMDDMWVVPADITLAFRVQLTNKFLLLGMQYSFAIPVLYVLLAAHMWLAHWVDRWNFLHRLSPPPPTHDRQMALVTGFMLPCSVALHLIMAPIFFWHICEKHGLNLDEDPSPSPPPSPPNVPAISPPNAPPPPSPPGATCTCESGLLTDMDEAVELWCDPTAGGGAYCMVEEQRWEACGDTQWSSAQLIVWGSSIIWGCVLVWYVYSGSLSQREKRSKERSQGKRMQVLPKRATKMFRFFMQRDVHAPPPRGGLPQGAHILPLSRKPRPGFCGDMSGVSPLRGAAGASAASVPAPALTTGGPTQTRMGSKSDTSDTSEAGGSIEPSPRTPKTPTIVKDLADSPQAQLSSAEVAVGSQRSSNDDTESSCGTSRDAAKSMCVRESIGLPPDSGSCPALTGANGCSTCSVCSADTTVGISVSASSAAPGAAPPPPSHTAASSSSLVEGEDSLLSPLQTFDRPAAQKAVLASASSAEDARAMEERLVAQAAAVAASGGADKGGDLGYRVMQHHQDEARRARHGGRGAKPEDVVQLEERTVFYLPPLVVTLLASFCKDATKTRREVNHYLKQHRPLEEAEACGHAAASHMVRRRSISSFAANARAGVNSFSVTLPNLPIFERRDSAAAGPTTPPARRPSQGPLSRLNSLTARSGRSNKSSRHDLEASHSFEGSEASSAPTADDEGGYRKGSLPTVLDEVEVAMTTLQTPRMVVGPRSSLNLSDMTEGDGAGASAMALEDAPGPRRSSVPPRLTKAESEVAEAEDLEREEAIHKLELASQKLAAEARKAQEQLNQEKEFRRGSALTSSVSSPLGSSHKLVEKESSTDSVIRSSLSMGNPVI